MSPRVSWLSTCLHWSCPNYGDRREMTGVVAWTCNPILERWSQEGWEVKASWGCGPSVYGCVYGCGWEELLGASRSVMLPRCQNRRNSRQVSCLLQFFFSFVFNFAIT